MDNKRHLNIMNACFAQRPAPGSPIKAQYNLVPRVLSLPTSRKDPGCSWSRDCTRQTSPQSGYPRSIILFAKVEQRFSSGHGRRESTSEAALISPYIKFKTFISIAEIFFMFLLHGLAFSCQEKFLDLFPMR